MIIVTVIVVWVALSLILLWFKPKFHKECGSLDWWTTFWVSLLLIFFAWIIVVIITCLIQWFRGSGECCNTCNRYSGFQVNMW